MAHHFEPGKPVGALFDWDGVVVDSSAHHEMSWELLAREIGKSLPTDHFIRGFGMKNQVVIRELLLWSDDPREIDDLSSRKESLYRDIINDEGVEPLPGAVSLMRMLNERGVLCAVASSTHRKNIELGLDKIGVGQWISAIVSAEDVEAGKPDPDVFVKGAAAIDRDPGACVVFEDALVGIVAGRAAGCKVVAVATTNSLDNLVNAHLAVATLEDVDWSTLASLFYD